MALASPVAPLPAIDETTPSLRVDWIQGKGRGVIAGRFFAAGMVIEKAPAVEFPAEERNIVDRTALFSHYFVDPGQYDVISHCDSRAAVRGYIAFGLSSLCNHAERPGARVRWRRDRLGLWADLIALRDLQPGEEITVYYTNIDEYPDRGRFLA